MKPSADTIKTFVRDLRNPKRHSSKIIWVLLVVLLIPIIIVIPEFVRPANIANVLIQMAPLGMVAIGQTYVILGGGIDLSVGSQISLISLIASTLMTDSPLNIIAVAALCLVCGVLFGALNGFILKLFPMPPIIVTLCTGYFFQGIAFALHKTSGGYIPVALKQVLTANSGFFSVPFGLYVLLFAIFAYVLYRTRFGRYVYALGGNADVLEKSGIRIDRIKIKTYMVSGLLCAIVGIYLAARLRSGSARYGDEYTLLSITATVVGGTSMAGGLGGLTGTFAGTILISMLTNVLNNIAFRYNLQSTYYKDIITGILLISAMYFYRNRK
ncbi:MAG: ABC transporter permease [Sphaerochaetaceae bacterium]|jgi:ribose/xylose/arabinose/galactoside ABC-type transport system permease subunit|nr:ABC transporter permease [Sphaerochaetaceae bacterium]MDD4259703.1 ABC transporter permease [Sphaerochaetaceae bacterium]NLO61524.1 ABC transporter permease [Spirochaetales bacterium]